MLSTQPSTAKPLHFDKNYERYLAIRAVDKPTKTYAFSPMLGHFQVPVSDKTTNNKYIQDASTNRKIDEGSKK